MKAFCVILMVVQSLLLINAQWLEREIVWGEVGSGSRLEINERVQVPATPNQPVTIFANFTTSRQITGIRATDIINAISAASVELSSGGINQREVSLILSSPIPSHALDFRVEIFTSGSFIIKSLGFFILMTMTLMISFLLK